MGYRVTCDMLHTGVLRRAWWCSFSAFFKSDYYNLAHFAALHSHLILACTGGAIGAGPIAGPLSSVQSLLTEESDDANLRRASHY